MSHTVIDRRTSTQMKLVSQSQPATLDQRAHDTTLRVREAVVGNAKLGFRLAFTVLRAAITGK